MINIQPPRNYDYSYDNGFTTGDDSRKPYLNYLQTINQYLAHCQWELSHLSSGDPTRAIYENYLQAAMRNRETALQDLQMLGDDLESDPYLGGSGWDPLSGNYGGQYDNGTGIPGSDPGTTQQAIKGDAPTPNPADPTSGQVGWWSSDADIYSRSDGQPKYVSLRNAARFHATSNSESWTVQWDGSRYVIRVFANDTDAKANDPNKAKEIFYMDDKTNLKATFDIDPMNIYFEGSLAGGNPPGSDPHSINTTDPHGKKLALVGSDGSSSSTPGNGAPLNPDYPKETGESVPKSIKGNMAEYDSDDVKVHTNFDSQGAVTGSNISAQTVELWPSNSSDTWQVNVLDDGSYLFIDTGKDTNGNLQSHTFIIKDPKRCKTITIHSDWSQIKKIGSFDPQSDPKIHADGVSNSDYPDGLKELLKDKQESDILSALKKAGYDYTTLADFVTAIKEKDGNPASLVFPPNPPDTQLIKFLFNLDPTLKGYSNDASNHLNDIETRLNSLLTTLYPDHKLGSFSVNGTALTFMFDKQIGLIDFNSPELDLAMTPLPTETNVISKCPMTDNHDLAEQMTTKVFEAIKANTPDSWQAVFDLLGPPYAPHDLNDALRIMMTGIYGALGNDEDKLKNFLKIIPADVRTNMVAILRVTEPDEQRGDEQWDNQTLAGLIGDTLA